MFLRVDFSCFLGMVGRVQVVAMGHMRVVACFFVSTSFVVFRSLSVMVGGFFVMVGSFPMVFCAFM